MPERDDVSLAGFEGGGFDGTMIDVGIAVSIAAMPSDDGRTRQRHWPTEH